MPSEGFGQAYVTGNYRGHRTKLESYQTGGGRGGYSCTRVTLTTASSTPGDLVLSNEDILNATLTRADVVNLLTPGDFRYRWGGEQIGATSNGRRIIYEMTWIETNVKRLQTIFDWLPRLWPESKIS